VKTLQEFTDWMASRGDGAEITEEEFVELAAGFATPVTAETAKAFLATEEGEPVAKSLADARVTAAIATWKENNLDKLVQTQYDELHPPETDADKRNRAMQAEIDELKAERKRDAMLSVAVKTANELELPADPDLLRFFYGSDEDETVANLNVWSSKFREALDAQVDAKFKAAGGAPPKKSGDATPSTANPFAAETRNLTEQGRIMREDPEKAARLKAAATS